jgi:thiamine biosynthesis protein ThiS
MKIHLNGEEREVVAQDLRALLLEMGLPVEGVAVAHNGTVVPRSRQSQTPLLPDDRVEVIRAVGGG